MAKIIPITEHFQHFLAEMKASFWGDLYGQTRQAWQQFFELQSERERDRFSGWGRYERRRGKRRVYRNGYYERDFVTRFGTIRLGIARTREKSFLPVGRRRFQRRAEEVSLLIREAFFARDQHPAGGSGSGDHDRRNGKRADGVEADAGFG
jgi:putative transposase